MEHFEKVDCAAWSCKQDRGITNSKSHLLHRTQCKQYTLELSNVVIPDINYLQAPISLSIL